MSIDKVKATLQKAKNYQVLIVDKALANMKVQAEQAIEQYANDLDPDGLKAGIVTLIEGAFADVDLYAHQADFEVSEIVTDLQAQTSTLQASLAEALEKLEAAEAQGKLATEQQELMTAEVDKLITDLQSKESELNAALASATEAQQVAQTYKQQYEATIAQQLPTELPAAAAPQQHHTPPPQGSEFEEDTDPKDIYQEIEAMYKKLSAKKS